MTDLTNDRHIGELLQNLGGGYWPEKHAALAALVAERDALIAERDALRKGAVVLKSQEFTLPSDPFRDADRDLRERLVESALRGVSLAAYDKRGTESLGRAAVWIVDAAIAAMRKGDTNAE